MAENFTAKQREIVARKLGYDGPMQGFDDYLNSSPALGMKYATLTDKFATRMAKGGLTRKKFQAGGAVTNQGVRDLYQQFAGRGADTSGLSYWSERFGDTIEPEEIEIFKSSIDEARAAGTEPQRAGVTTAPAATTPKDDAGAPLVPGATTYTAQQTDATAPGMKVSAPDAVAVEKATAVKGVAPTDVAAAPTVTATDATTVSAAEPLKTAQADMKAETGTLSEGSKVSAQQGTVSDKAVAEVQKVGQEFIKPVTSGVRTTGAGELVTAVTDAPTIKAEVEQTAAPEKVVAATGTVQANELVQAEQIAESDIAQAQAITADGLAPDAKVVAARLEKFTVDDGTLAAAVQGDVDALSTVQGQLSQLMNSFNDGKTPAWAAGAIRAANAAMSARGLGGSSMASTAIFQAAMESALPIAQQDAKTFADMGLTNLNNRQQTALANAAAQQGLSLANLDNEQAARLQNAANSFALQSLNLTNMQQTMLANTQIRATLQGKNLDNRQQAAVVNAARYAEMADVNLNNLQQVALHNSNMQVQVDIANTSNRQQAALANAQIEAAMQGKILDNKQQAAVLNAARIAENANLTFNAAEAAALHNSEMMKSIGIANLSAAQSATIANAATYATMDIANLNNRQQAAVQNAKAFLETDLKNLDNKQQMAVLKSQQIGQSILNDASAANAASLTNATNATEVSKINATLTNSVNQFNALEKNKVAAADALASNELIKFNAQEANDRAEFNSRMSAEISVANAKILADVSTANTAAVNAANAVNAKNATDLSSSAYAQQSQTYRDLLSYSWKSGESSQDRITNLAIASIQKDVANIKADSEDSKTTGSFFIEAAKNISTQDVKDGWEWAKSLI